MECSLNLPICLHFKFYNYIKPYTFLCALVVLPGYSPNNLPSWVVSNADLPGPSEKQYHFSGWKQCEIWDLNRRLFFLIPGQRDTPWEENPGEKVNYFLLNLLFLTFHGNRDVIKGSNWLKFHTTLEQPLDQKSQLGLMSQLNAFLATSLWIPGEYAPLLHSLSEKFKIVAH